MLRSREVDAVRPESEEQLNPIRPRYQVFVSSTFSDLATERRAVMWALLSRRYIPVGMEAFPATDERGWEIIRRTVDLSDYYVLIVGGRYGTIDASSAMGWTEREYRYAQERRMRTLVFLQSPNAIVESKSESEESARQRLTAFKAELRSTHLAK